MSCLGTSQSQGLVCMIHSTCFLFLFNKNIRVGMDPSNHLVQPPCFTRGGNWDPERNLIYSRSHSELIEEARSRARPLISGLLFFITSCSVPSRTVSLLPFLLGSITPSYHPSFSSLCQGVCLTFLDVLVLMVKVSLSGGEKVGIYSVLSLPLN